MFFNQKHVFQQKCNKPKMQEKYAKITHITMQEKKENQKIQESHATVSLGIDAEVYETTM